jgi:hypothetical protein
MPHQHHIFMREGFAMPKADIKADTLSRHYCTLFMHQFLSMRSRDICTRIRQAIETTAVMSGTKAGMVAEKLVECGLRADRHSFPDDFVRALESARVTPEWNLTAATPSQKMLMRFWQQPPEAARKRLSAK